MRSTLRTVAAPNATRAVSVRAFVAPLAPLPADTSAPAIIAAAAAAAMQILPFICPPPVRRRSSLGLPAQSHGRTRRWRGSADGTAGPRGRNAAPGPGPAPTTTIDVASTSSAVRSPPPEPRRCGGSAVGEVGCGARRRGGGPASEEPQRRFIAGTGIGRVGEDRQAAVGSEIEALEVEVEVADDGVVEALDAVDVQADVVRRSCGSRPAADRSTATVSRAALSQSR